MTALSVPALPAALAFLFFASALPAQTTTPAATSPAEGLSKVRIVRLSEVKGEVQVDLSHGQGYEAAVPNLPVVEGTRLRTSDGAAEVEFEDNSTLRLAPDSEVSFPQLERNATGGTLSTVHVISGTVYATLLKSPQNQFGLLFGREKVDLPARSHVRVNVGTLEASLAVLDGTAQVTDSSGTVEVPHKKTATFVWTDTGAPAIRKDVVAESYDSWDKSSSQYHDRVASASAFGSAPYAYGLNDMMYYGSFMDAGGCGMMWRPYFASAAWDPYGNGAWAWYQGAGYSWVSPYPWGWTPYHSGMWSFCPGTGWGWQPGGSWYGLNNGAVIASATNTGGAILPHPPIAPPRTGHPIIHPVNRTPLVVSSIDSRSSFVFRRDSAGMGIPREGLGKLNGFSRSSLSHGTAATPVYMTGAVQRPMGGFNRSRPMPGGTMRPTNSLMTAGSIHRGFAPAAMPSVPGMSGQRGMGMQGSFHGTSAPTAGPVMSSPSVSISSHAGGAVAAPRGH